MDTTTRSRTASLLLAAAALLAPTAAPSLLAQTTVLITATPTGAPGMGEGGNAALTPDGRYLAFESSASDLVPGDTNGVTDIFVRDTWTSTTERILAPGGQQANASCHFPAISADGRYVAFRSAADNLVPGDTNATWDIFRHDRWTGQVVRASTTSAGAQGNGYSTCSVGAYMSADGRYVSFSSYATNFGGTSIEQVWRKDLQTGTLMGISASANGVPGNLWSASVALSPDGRFAAFSSIATNLVPGDTNGTGDIFVRDLVTGVIVRASVGPGGVQGNGGSLAWPPDISDGGRYVIFLSYADNLVPGDTNGASDVFRRDLLLGETTRVSVGTGNIQGNASNTIPIVRLSGNGRFAIFTDESTNLDPTLNLAPGQYSWRRDIEGDSTTLLSTDHQGQPVEGCLALDLARNDEVVLHTAADGFMPGLSVHGDSQLYLRTYDFCDPPYTYCVSTQSPLGCLPAIAWSGSPSLSNASGGGNLRIHASDVVSSRLGLLFYGPGQAFYPFFGGIGCVAPPLVRTTPQNSGGSAPGVDCTGRFDFDFRAWALSGADPALQAGARVCAQYWFRDPAASGGAGLSDAIDFILCP